MRKRILKPVSVSEIAGKIQMDINRKREVYREAYRLGIIEKQPKKPLNELTDDEKTKAFDKRWSDIQKLTLNHLNK